MKLDKRFEILPFHCFSAEKCIKYVGQKGYFTNNIDFFKKIDLCIYGTLEEVHAEQADSFQMDNRKFFRYFIPEYFVKPKEKKYRPYTMQEFLKKFPIGKPIIFRQKRATLYERYLLINGYSYDDWNGLPTPYICIGNILYSLDALFVDYEYKEDCTEDFKPFGVEQ